MRAGMHVAIAAALALPALADAAPRQGAPTAPMTASTAPSAPTANDRLEAMQREIDALLNKVHGLEKEAERARQQDQRISELEAEVGERWLSEQRAAQIRDIVHGVLDDAETRKQLNSSGAVAGYDRNFFVASTDGKFRLNVNGQVQTRFSWNQVPGSALVPTPGLPSTASEYGFEMQSVRINLFGHVFDPSWEYRVQFAYERDGAQNLTPLRFEDVYLQKALGNGFYVRAGQWMNFFNYEQIVSYKTLQFADRSLVNQYFSTLFVQGVLLGWESEQVRLYASYNDGANNRDVGVIQARGNQTDYALTGRVEWKPFGAWGQFADMQGWRGSPLALMVGAGINWQRASGDLSARGIVGNGQLTPTVLSPANFLTWAVDANLRGDGWSFWAAFLGNVVSDVNAAGQAAGVDDALSLGVVVQGGVFVADGTELIGKYEGLWVESGVSGFSAGTFNPGALDQQTLGVITLGVNQYFNKNGAKVTLDGGWAFTPVRFNNGLFGQSIAAGDWRASQTGQGTGEFVIRLQAQVLF